MAWRRKVELVLPDQSTVRLPDGIETPRRGEELVLDGDEFKIGSTRRVLCSTGTVVEETIHINAEVIQPGRRCHYCDEFVPPGEGYMRVEMYCSMRCAKACREESRGSAAWGPDRMERARHIADHGWDYSMGPSLHEALDEIERLNGVLESVAGPRGPRCESCKNFVRGFEVRRHGHLYCSRYCADVGVRQEEE